MDNNLMSHKQELELQLKMQQKILPNQLMLMKLLQVPRASLLQRVEDELEENPALELAIDDDSQDADYNYDTENGDTSPETEQTETVEETGQNSELSLEEYFPDDNDYNSDFYYNTRGGKDDSDSLPNYEQFIRAADSVQDMLVSQLNLLNLSQEDRDLTYFLIGNIDPSGYLTRKLSDIVNDLLFTSNVCTTEQHLEHLLVNVVQQFEPAGVGARNLQESLKIQLSRMKDDENQAVREMTIRMVECAFDDFTGHYYDRLKKKLPCDDEQIKQIREYLLKLKPKPFLGMDDGENNYITPDFIVTYNDKTDSLECSLPAENLPPLRVGYKYKNLFQEIKNNPSLQDKDRKEAIDFVRQKLNAAKWFIDALSQRKQTLYRVILAIVNRQKDFFMTGEENKIKPLVHKDIASDLEIDISTVSRATRHKHVLTDYGVYPLKFFFSESLSKLDESTVSPHEVKKLITDIIQEEDAKKPLSDIEICDKLTKLGYNIARRTVAKYREALGIPVARKRTNI